METEVRPEERIEPERRWWRKEIAGEGLSDPERPPPYWAEGEIAYTKQMDIWDEGQEPADPTLVLFGGVVSLSVTSALGPA